jgi:hypothetical protein
MADLRRLEEEKRASRLRAVLLRVIKALANNDVNGALQTAEFALQESDRRYTKVRQRLYVEASEEMKP